MCLRPKPDAGPGQGGSREGRIHASFAPEHRARLALAAERSLSIPLRLLTSLASILIGLSALSANSADAQDSPEPLAASYEIVTLGPALIEGVVIQQAEIDPDDNRIPPLVVLLGGSNGGLWFGGFLRDLTARRISTLSLSYFGHEGQPDQLIERPLEPIAAVIELARETRGAQQRCLAVVGVSKGGELALLLAAHEQDFAGPGHRLIDATIAASPSNVVWQAPHIRLEARSSWSIAGRALDFVPYPWLSTHLPDVVFNRYEVGEYHVDALQNERAVEAAEIPVERIAHPALLLAGQNDVMWPAARMSQAALERARRLNPDTPVRLEIRELDHFVMSDADTRRLAIDFLLEALRNAEAAGDCQADFD